MRKSLFIISLLSGLIFYGCSSTSTDPGDSTTQFQVALSSSPADAGDATPETGQYDEGTTLEISATANEGWRFVEWTGDHTGTNSTTTITVDADKNISAIYEKKSYALTTNTSGEGTVDEKIVAAKATDYDHGTVVELTANPETGWIFVEWQGDVTGSQNPHELTVDKTKDVTAVFQKKTFSLTLSTTGQGSIAKNPDQQEYEYDTVVELTANAENGWQFSEWQGGITGTNNPVQLTVDEGKNVTAVFMENSQSLFYLAQNGVTIKCEDATIGDTGTVNGITYTKRSASQITPGNAETTCTSSITSMKEMFFYDRNFNADITHWDVGNVTSMEEMFKDAWAFNQDISYWDVSSVRGMSGMFDRAEAFNSNISGWDVSSVKNMSGMFTDTESFNQNIDSWDVSEVTDMTFMFYDAEVFNSDLNNWDVSNVTDMYRMFYVAESFNGAIGNWDVGSVTNMAGMFRGATNFNGDLSNWDVGNVEDFTRMFNGAEAFNSNLNNWDISSATSISVMFRNAKSFNSDLKNWDVSNLESIREVFYGASAFNGDLSGWDVSNVKRIDDLFAYAKAFNGDISSWDVSSVLNMSRMFAFAESFNRNISGWDVSNVGDMGAMFREAKAFDKDLSDWCVTKISSYPSNFAPRSFQRNYLPVWGTCP